MGISVALKFSKWWYLEKRDRLGLYYLTALLEFGKGNAKEPTYYESSLRNNKKTEIRTTNYHANKNSTKMYLVV